MWGGCGASTPRPPLFRFRDTIPRHSDTAMWPDNSPTLYLLGPTGVGKSAVAMALARRFPAEILGADSMQIYEGMTVLTAAPSLEDRRAVLHHMVGCIDPRHTFSAGEYAQAAGLLLARNGASSVPTVVVGGTGLYVRGLLQGFDSPPPHDPALRSALTSRPLEELLSELHERAPRAFERVDQNNPRRVQRALEIAILSGTDPGVTPVVERPLATAAPGIILTRGRAELARRGTERLTRIAHSGEVFSEIEALPTPLSPTAEKAIGLSSGREVLRGNLSVDEWISRTSIATRQYAKRQLTWFRNQLDFPVLVISGNEMPEVTADRILALLREGPPALGVAGA